MNEKTKSKLRRHEYSDTFEPCGVTSAHVAHTWLNNHVELFCVGTGDPDELIKIINTDHIFILMERGIDMGGRDRVLSHHKTLKGAIAKVPEENRRRIMVSLPHEWDAMYYYVVKKELED